MRDHQGANGIITGAATGIANHVGVTFLQSGIGGRVEPGIHADEDGNAAGRRQRQGSLRPKRLAIALIGLQDGGAFSLGAFSLREIGNAEWSHPCCVPLQGHRHGTTGIGIVGYAGSVREGCKAKQGLKLGI